MTLSAEERVEKYIKYFDEFDLTYEQKVEYIHTLYDMFDQIMDVMFETDPVSVVLREREREKTRETQGVEAPDIRDFVRKTLAAENPKEPEESQSGDDHTKDEQP